MKIFAAALIGIVALAEAKGGVAKTPEGRLAESYNHHRAECNANTDRPDGIQLRKKDMTTLVKHKNALLADCDHLATDPEMKLRCIESNVWLKTGKVNYINYVGARLQGNTCRRLNGIEGCDIMCKEFFQLWHEPVEGSCDLVKPEWNQECVWRVQLIQEKLAEQWDAAEITQGKLDGLYPDLEPEYKPVQVAKLVKTVNPWLRNKGVYDLPDLEIATIVSEFKKDKHKNDKCVLLKGWHDRKYELLMDGYVEHENLHKPLKWFTSEEAALKKYTVNRQKQIDANKVFFNMTEADYQHARKIASVEILPFLTTLKAEQSTFENQNARKQVALGRLAFTKCRLGNGTCYAATKSCDAISAFYKRQQEAIDHLRHTRQGIIRDYEYYMWSPAKMAAAMSKANAKIQKNKDALALDINNVQKAYGGQAMESRVNERTRGVEMQNQYVWRRYLRLEARNEKVLVKKLDLERELEAEVQAIIDGGKAEEAKLLANLI